MNTQMKKINKIILGLSIVFTIASCTDEFKFGNDFLDKMPGEDITIDSVFAKSELAQQFLWNTYSTLFYGLNWDWSDRGNGMNMGLPEALTDNFQSYLTWDNVNKMYYTGKYNASEENNQTVYNYTLEGSWIGIRKAWIFIENVDRVPDMDDATKARLKAEAKMIIACHYADMYRHFGGLPLIKKAFTTQDDLEIPRATAKETLQFITGLCDEAFAVLPWKLTTAEMAKWDGRFTGGGALGLKIRMLLFAASPLFNDNVPYYTAKTYESIEKKQVWFGAKDETLWNDVVEACDLFFQINAMDAEGGYMLTSGDPRLAFRQSYFARGTTEMLISSRIRYNVPDYWNASYYCLQSLGSYGACTPTLEYSDLFPMADGTPFNKNIWNDTLAVDRINGPGDTVYLDPFANRDPRFYETCLVNNADYQGRKAELWMSGRERGNQLEAGAAATGMSVYKFILDKTNATSIGAPAQWPYLRLAEIYLSYAEALNQVGRTEEAFTWVDLVRARVGLKGLKESYPGRTWTKEVFLNEVLDERSREFGLEGVRLFDMKRWKRADDFRKRLSGVRIKRIIRNKLVVPNRYSYQKFTLFKRAWQDDEGGTINFDPKWYLSAFPIAEIYKDYGLTQNPGW